MAGRRGRRRLGWQSRGRLLLTAIVLLQLALVTSLAPISLADDDEAEQSTATPTSTVEPTATLTPTLTPTPSSSPTPTATPAAGRSSSAPGASPSPTDAPPITRFPVPDDQPADYPLPNGHFYTQAAPGATRGFGFTVDDAAGIPLWREFQRLGGFDKLGYPISRRFLWGDNESQAFQQGVLRWRAARQQAEIEPQRRHGPLPEPALQPEPPPRLGGWARHQPWSGWWWPATTLVSGPHLFDSDGPLAKYDLLVEKLTGKDPQTLEWERKELWLEGLSWAGHCNGWAAAALLENEPTEVREVAGIRFTVADQKGLLTSYHFADAAAWLHGNEQSALSPVDFHRRLVEWLGVEQRGFVLTFRPDRDDEVWSFPVYRFELLLSADTWEPGLTHVRAMLWLADNEVPANYVGLRPWRGGAQSYSYTLRGPREAPTSGEWVVSSAAGRFARPDTIWYPDPATRNLGRVLASPNLEYSTIEKVLQRRKL
jgi:hypothetical protein